MLERAIGVIDSGVGGITVVLELMRQLPHEQLIYLGDTKRCPYGPRKETQVIQFTWEMVNFLLQKNIKALVVACNTATAFALPQLQKKLPIPVVGVVQPGARAAIKSTKNNQVGVIGTEGTIRSQAYVQALKKINAQIDIQSLACPEFVPMIEKGHIAGEKIENIVETSLKPLKTSIQMDTLILGCTHYPLIKRTIQKVMGHDVTLVSSSEETARETSTILDVHHLLYEGIRTPQHTFYTTGDLKQFENILTTIFEQEYVEQIHRYDIHKIDLTKQSHHI